MPALAGEPWRGLAKVQMIDAVAGLYGRNYTLSIDDVDPNSAAGNLPTWEKTYEQRATSFTLRLEWSSFGAVPVNLGPAEAFTVTMNLPSAGGAVGSSWAGAISGNSGVVTRTFHFDSDPLNEVLGVLTAGMLEPVLSVQKDSAPTWGAANSRGAGSNIPAGTTHNWARGKLARRLRLDSYVPSNVSLGGAEPASFAYPDSMLSRAVLDAPLYRAEALTLEHYNGATLIRTQAGASTVSATRDWSWSATSGLTARVHNAGVSASGVYPNGGAGTAAAGAYPAGSAPVRIVLPVRDFGGDNELVWGATLEDSSGNGKTGYFVGSVYPTLEASDTGFGNRIAFDGVDRDGQTAGIRTDAGVVLAAGASFTYDQRIKHRTVTGRVGGVSAGLNGSYFEGTDAFGAGTTLRSVIMGILDADGADANKLYAQWHDAGNVQRSLTGTTVHANNAIVRARLRFNSATSTMELVVNGAVENSMAATSFAGLDGSKPFYVGRLFHAASAGASPFHGAAAADNVRVSNIYRTDDDSVPFVSDANTKLLWNCDALGPHIAGWAVVDNRTLHHASRIVVDPRILFDGHMQLDDDTYDTPPVDGGQKRLSSQEASIGFFIANARAEGINQSVANHGVDLTLFKPSGAIRSQTLDQPTATQGGRVGGTALVGWDSSLPAGTHSFRGTFTDVAGTQGQADYPLVLQAFNPNVQVVTNITKFTRQDAHLMAGENILIVGYALDRKTRIKIPPDTDTVFCAVTRHNATSGRREHLVSDTLNTEAAWESWDELEPLVIFQMTASAGDPRVFEKVFAYTGGWSKDNTAQTFLDVNGTPYSSDRAREVVGRHHQHDTEPFQWAGVPP